MRNLQINLKIRFGISKNNTHIVNINKPNPQLRSGSSLSKIRVRLSVKKGTEKAPSIISNKMTDLRITSFDLNLSVFILTPLVEDSVVLLIIIAQYIFAVNLKYDYPFSTPAENAVNKRIIDRCFLWCVSGITII